MLKALPFAVLAAGLAGCGTFNNEPQRSAQPQPQPQAQAPLAARPAPVEAGAGVVTQVFPAPPNAGSAAGSAAGSGPSGARYQRLEVRMDNGRTQLVDVPITAAIGEFSRGMRVEITENGRIRQL
jgi:hypothetical protein